MSPAGATISHVCSAAPQRRRATSQRSISHAVVCRAHSSDSDSGDALEHECPVPRAQQPVMELKQLQGDSLMRLAEKPAPELFFRLFMVYVGFFALVGIPVSAATFAWPGEAVQFLASASVGSCVVVTVVLLRIYLGWSFVGERLLSATVDYEETGWYDGETWVKPPAVLMRDRLLNNHTVLPAMRRVRASLLAAASASLASVAALQLGAAVAPASVTAPQPPPLASQPTPSQEEYWDRVAQYEPWALDDDDADTASGADATRMSVLDHMRVPV